VISISLEDPDGRPLPPARPGQYITLRLQPDKQERSVLRTRIAVGDQLEIAAPRGTFILDQTHAPVLLISAGIGATPVLSMLHALATEHSDREIWWLHGARSSREHSFAAEAGALLASLQNVRTHVCYSRPRPDDLEGRDFDSAGRLTASLLAELGPPRNAEAYLCGPTPFMEEISASLAATGLRGTDIHTGRSGRHPD
jgi:ferredoxin-NADP reductase